MESIYVLSDPNSAKVNEYKVGITTRNKNKLLQDYRRSRPEVVLYLFERSVDNRKLENIVLDHFEKCRIKHESNRLSEWLKVEIDQLLNFIRTELSKEHKFTLTRKEDPIVYQINDFMKDKCYLGLGYADSSKNLHNEYITANKLPKLAYLTFCKKLTTELSGRYHLPKKDLKYKSSGVMWYKGIILIKNYTYGQSCVLI